MSIYRMIRKGIEFDVDRAFQTAADAKHFTNTAGLIEVMEDADRKFVFVTGDEPDIEEIAAERIKLAEAVGKRALDFIKQDQGDKALSRITRATNDIIRNAHVSAAPAPRS
jgi:hypothetical protein